MSKSIERYAAISETITRRYSLACERLIKLHIERCNILVAASNRPGLDAHLVNKSNLEMQNAIQNVTETIVCMGENKIRLVGAIFGSLEDAIKENA